MASIPRVSRRWASSAGGHVCADLATRFAASVYQPVDAADTLSARPLRRRADLSGGEHERTRRAYGLARGAAGQGSERGAGAGAFAAAQRHRRTPPTFLVHAEDDDVVPVENSLLLRAALRKQGVPIETHLFTGGGHGFGLRRIGGKPAEIWPELFVRWAASQGL
jgi:acetyl esterase/lipase